MPFRSSASRARALAVLVVIPVLAVLAAAPARGATSHVVAPGETLSGIASVSGLSTETLASWNGLAADHLVIEGSTISVPTPEEAGVSAPEAVATAAPAPALGAIWSPWGTLYLDPAAAEAWNAMRDEALAVYGQDLYPAGPLSAYRTSAEQGQLYDLFLSGAGAPANPPGSSSHEYGLSVDLASEEMLYVVEQIGWQYGWGRYEAPDEWWHVTYGG